MGLFLSVGYGLTFAYLRFYACMYVGMELFLRVEYSLTFVNLRQLSYACMEYYRIGLTFVYL